MSVLPTPSIQLARSLAAPAEDLSSMDAFELFQHQLESGSAEAAVDAMKRLPVVAVAMGEAAAHAATGALPHQTRHAPTARS